MKTKDFAELIGVSRVTLSKVLNGKPGVAKETREKVKEYIKEYNFIPNNSARNLAGKRNDIIGLFFKVPSVTQNDSGTSSHFSSEFTNYVINEVQKRNYKLLISTIDNDFEEIERCFKSGLISGAILLGYSREDTELEKIISSENKILVVNQEESPPSKNVKIVNMDDFNGAYSAMEELIKNNHKRILYIGSDSKRLPAIRRERGVRKFYENNRGKLDAFRIENGNFTKHSGYAIMKKILEEKEEIPTGVFAANDFMAIGVMAAIKEKGLKVPEDISVIGFDDIEISKYVDPPLTTVRCDFEEIAGKAVNTLINFIEGKKTKAIQECETSFIKRETLKNIQEE